MKNALQYYYNLSTDHIHLVDQEYRFQIKDRDYVLCPCVRDTEEIKQLYELSNALYQQQCYCHQIIANKGGQFITIINQIPYVLMLIFQKSRTLITMDDVVMFNHYQVDVSKFRSLVRNHWFELWTKKVDYFEYQISQIGKKFPIIRESFSYYIGMAENAIQLFRVLQNDQTEYLVVCHKRINQNYTIYDLYNPLNFVVDSKVRDISEYIKSRIGKEEKMLDTIKQYVYYSQLTQYECGLLFCRLLFPSFYFDNYEKITLGDRKEEELVDTIKHHHKYEQFLKELYQYFRLAIQFPEIEWLQKIQ